MTRTLIAALALPVVLLAACQPGTADGGSAPGEAGDAAIPDPASSEPYAGIAESETLRFTGTEPFWGGEATGGSLTYTTPEDPDGTTIAVERFAGRGGLSFSGSLAGAALVMSVTPGACSDGMSDRSYPFTVTLELGGEQRNGCGWTDRQPFTGPEQP
jgi:uncharacterized membrane protein